MGLLGFGFWVNDVSGIAIDFECGRNVGTFAGLWIRIAVGEPMSGLEEGGTVEISGGNDRS